MVEATAVREESAPKPDVSNGLQGYHAPYVIPGFAALLALAVWVNEVHLHWIGIPHALILFNICLLLVVHEGLRPHVMNLWQIYALVLLIVWTLLKTMFAYRARGGHPKFPEWTIWWECFQAISYAVGTRTGAHIVKIPNAQIFRRNTEVIGAIIGPISCWQHGTNFEKWQYNGLTHLWVKPKRSDPTKTVMYILYFHGGGYALMSPDLYVGFSNRLMQHIQDLLAAKAIEDVEVHVLLANYHKIPEFQHPVPVDDALVMYEFLVKELNVSPTNVVLAGDSAGAGLVMSTLLRLRDSSRQLPLAAICSCPFVDMTDDEPDAQHCFITKAMINAIRPRYVPSGCHTRPETWKCASSVHCSLTSLPAMLIQTAELDLVHQHALRLAKRAQADGVAVVLDVHKNMPHVFTFFPKFILPASEIGIQRMAAFAVAQWQARNSSTMNMSLIAASLMAAVATVSAWEYTHDLRAIEGQDCDLEGAALYNVVGGYYECSDACFRDSRCTHWTWSTEDGGLCEIKTSPTGTIGGVEGSGCGYIIDRFYSHLYGRNPSENNTGDNDTDYNNDGGDANSDNNNAIASRFGGVESPAPAPSPANNNNNHASTTTPTITPAPSPASNTNAGSYSNGMSAAETTEMLNKINEFRARFDRPALVLNQKLMQSADDHSRDQASRCKMGHTGSDGSAPWDRAQRRSYESGSVWENVAANQKTVDEVMDAWWNSKGHRDNILEPTVTEIAAIAVSTVVVYATRGFKPIFPEWTLLYEIAQRGARCCMQQCGHRFVELPFARVLRQQSAFFGTLFSFVAEKAPGVTVETVHHLDMDHVWLRAPQGHGKRYVVVYYHGGGYSINSPQFYVDFCLRVQQRVLKLLKDTEPTASVDVLLANYRKIPEHPFPAPAEDAFTMYQFVLAQTELPASHVIVAGDSAGGGLVMSVLLRLREAAQSMPLAAVVSFPYVDLSGTEKDADSPHCMLSQRFTDAIRETYVPAGSDESTWKDASAVHCDLHGLPPTLIQTSDGDLLYQHAVRLRNKMKTDGCAQVEWDCYPHMPHVFHLFPPFMLPHASKAINAMAGFIVRKVTDAKAA
ncbi:TPA: hypothetical protein N0F65_005373 [Lagenidium giganteum]|uniref:Alpha/beta hydrolase fold-3 domain-containing protein n=1 Tax=Lagenidium giganteum TaxID=4803 RepID=A0AAV2YI04_9STRA|nr:TPA: hypothetical protein N0F65_005373 [Lagenidium giganteum]